MPDGEHIFNCAACEYDMCRSCHALRGGGGGGGELNGPEPKSNEGPAGSSSNSNNPNPKCHSKITAGSGSTSLDLLGKSVFTYFAALNSGILTARKGAGSHNNQADAA